MAGFELKAGPLSLSWGGAAKADATPAPLPRVEQKGGGPVPEPFNRLVDPSGALERNPLTRPMAQSVWVMRAIKSIAEPIVAVPLEFSLMAADGTEKPYKNPTLKAFWEYPVKGLSQEEFIEASVGWLKLRGEVFFVMDDSWLAGPKGTKGPLLMPRPAAMREIVDRRVDELVGWELTLANGGKSLLIPDQVLQIKYWNPDNKWRGLPEMEAARMAAEADWLQGRFASNLARNNGDQGVFVVAKGNMPTEEQQRQIVMALRMKRESALRGENRPIFLAGDISIEDPKIQTPDADFISQRLENRHEVAIAFGLPPSMFDVVASYSVGSASDRYRLIEDTCIPTAKKLTKGFAQISRRLLRLDPGTPLTASFNFDQHSVMLQIRTERLAATDMLWPKGVPMKVCSEYLHLNLPEYKDWDKSYLPINVSPAEDLTAVDPATSKDFAEANPANNLSPEQEEEEGDPVKALRRVFEQRHGGTVVLKQSSARKALWKKHAAQRMPSIRLYQAKIKSVLAGARSEVLAKLAHHYGTVGKTIVTRAGAASTFMFNEHDFAAEFRTAMDVAARSAYDDAGQQLFDEIGREDPWTAPPAKVKAFLATRENKLRNVPQEVFDQIKGHLQQGIDAGESIKDLSARMVAAFDEINAGRGRTIAMTETGAAYGASRQDAMEASGIQHKKWLTSGNANVREAHAEAEGQVRSVDHPFDVDGEEIDYPGDPEGSPENVINCHCVSIPSEEDS